MTTTATPTPAFSANLKRDDVIEDSQVATERAFLHPTRVLAQDTSKEVRDLTLNLGLRYDIMKDMEVYDVVVHGHPRQRFLLLVDLARWSSPATDRQLPVSETIKTYDGAADHGSAWRYSLSDRLATVAATVPTIPARRRRRPRGSAQWHRTLGLSANASFPSPTG